MELRDSLATETADSSIEDIRRFLPFFIQERYGAFLEERQQEVLAQVEQALKGAGLEDVPAPSPARRSPAPGLHPYVPPDFLEESILITTFMAVIGLTMRGVVAGAVMTLGPVLRMLTRDLRERDQRGALVRRAEAASIEAGQLLERQIAETFTTTIEAVRAAAQPTATVEAVPPMEDTARLAARERVETLLRALPPARTLHDA
jgi:hypothetical protein